MDEIYNKKNNTFNFKKIVIHPKLSCNELIKKISISDYNRIDCKDGTKAFILKQIKLKNYYYLIFLKFNEMDLINNFSVQINDKRIVIPKNWNEYNDDEENKKLILESEWLKKEKIVNNDEISVLSCKGRDDGLARIIVSYTKNSLKNDNGMFNKLKKLFSSKWF